MGDRGRVLWEQFIRRKDHLMEVFEKHKTFISLSGTVLSAAAAWAAYTSRTYREAKLNARIDEINEKLASHGRIPQDEPTFTVVHSHWSLLEIMAVPIASVSFVAGLTVGRRIYMPKEGTHLAQRTYRFSDKEGAPEALRRVRDSVYKAVGRPLPKETNKPQARQSTRPVYTSMEKYFSKTDLGGASARPSTKIPSRRIGTPKQS